MKKYIIEKKKFIGFSQMNKQSLIVGYLGRRGAGKSTAMVNDAYNYYLRGYKIYTNMLSVGFAEYISEKDILILAESDGFNECVLLIDEIQVLFDSRRSSRKENVNFLYFIQQLRKRNVTLLYTTQFSRRVDVGIREHTDIVATPKIIDKTEKHKVILCAVVYEDITASMNNEMPQYFKKVFIANDVFNLFDTKEKIQSLKSDKKEVKKRIIKDG
jgi:hypothetical protein